jgi:hypothetical protein
MELRHVTLILKGGVSGLLASAGIIKLGDPIGFQAGIQSFGLFPDWSITTIAQTTPWLEILYAAALWIPQLQFAGAAGCTALSAVFATIYAISWLLGTNPDCGCFGTEIWKVSAPEGTLRGTAMLAASLAIWLHRPTEKTRKR